LGVFDNRKYRKSSLLNQLASTWHLSSKRNTRIALLKGLENHPHKVLKLKMARSSELLFVHATIITMNATRDIILDGAILVAKKNIVAIGKTTELLSAASRVAIVIDCSNKIIIPGLVNTHVHLMQSLMRGLAEDLPLYSWLCEAIWKLEAQLEGEDGYVAAKLTIAEMLKGGTTCFLEAMLTHQGNIDNVARAVGEMGIRACVVCCN
jgi:cytosine/adenosine deaminase-related metal-dependent hydrolase